MKKYFIFSSLLLCFVLFAGCSKSIEFSAKVDSEEAIYEYIQGDIKGADVVEAKTSDGNVYNGEILNNKYQISIPALGEKQKVSISAKNKTNSVEKELELLAKKPFDDYFLFSLSMNKEIKEINNNAKISFPSEVKNGISDVSNQNGVIATVNVYNDKILGIQLRTDSDINKEIPTVLLAFQKVYNASSENIAIAYNNILKDKEKTSFTANGYDFIFEYDGTNEQKGNTLFVDIYKK